MPLTLNLARADKEEKKSEKDTDKRVFKTSVLHSRLPVHPLLNQLIGQLLHLLPTIFNNINADERVAKKSGTVKLSEDQKPKVNV